MALRARNEQSIAELAKNQEGGEGQAYKIAEVLMNRSTILQDAPVVKANDGLNFNVGIRALLPKPTLINAEKRVKPGAGAVRDLEFHSTKMRSYCAISKDNLDFLKNDKRTILLEEKAHIQGMNHLAQRLIIYGDPATDPLEFPGITRFYSESGKNNADQIIDAAVEFPTASKTGTKLRDILVVAWSTETVYLFHPVGVAAGLKRVAPKLEESETSDGFKPIYLSRFDWSLGCVIKDPRAVIRIVNIDLDLVKTNAHNLPRLVQKAVNRIYPKMGVRTAIYSDIEVMEEADRQAKEEVKSSTLVWKDVYGRGVENITCQGNPWHAESVMRRNIVRFT